MQIGAATLNPGSVTISSVTAKIQDSAGNALTSTTSALDVNIKNASIPVTGTFWQATQPVSGAFYQATQPVSIASMPTTAVTGTFWQATQPVSFTGSGDVATQTTLSAINTKLVSGTDIGDVTINNSTGAAAVNIQDGGNAITVDGTVSANATLTAETTKIIGTVNIAAAQTLATVTTVGAVTAITNALPAGTNAIGKLAANSGVDIGDVDITSLPALVAGTAEVGSLLPPDTDVTAHTNYARKYYTSAGAATDGIIWSPSAGKRWHVVTLYIQTSAAATITLEDDKAAGDDPVWKGEIAANSGVALSFTEQYPMASGEDAADLIITTSAGNVYVTCVGYEI